MHGVTIGYLDRDTPVRLEAKVPAWLKTLKSIGMGAGKLQKGDRSWSTGLSETSSSYTGHGDANKNQKDMYVGDEFKHFEFEKEIKLLLENKGIVNVEDFKSKGGFQGLLFATS